MSMFALASWGALIVVVALAATRSRAYAAFRGIQLTLHTLMATAVFARFQAVWPLFLYLHVLVYLQALVLVRPRMRPWWYRALVSVPASFFSAGTILAMPWALMHAFGFELPWVWLPYLLALIGVVQSLWLREEHVHVVVADSHVVDGAANANSELKRHPLGTARVARPLNLVQITDPHLGPFMSVERLREICESAVRRNPDLILLTGDFLTMESQADPRWLAQALEPLRGLPGRVFACFGNHDHEAPHIVRNALSNAGVRLLMDESTVVATEAGPVQIVGADFAFRERARHLTELCRAHPREPGAFRLLLLHDPLMFKHLPEGEADLVLSGHTHGGQVGLVSLGLPWTMMRLFVKAPDHGLWARGSDRLYVHRGTGHYGFPLRLGVPGENSLLSVHAPRFAAWGNRNANDPEPELAPAE